MTDTEFSTEARAELANILRCYDRDNIPRRRRLTGVEVHITNACANHLRKLLAGEIQTAPSLAAICPHPFALVNLDTDQPATGFDSLDEARAAAAFDRLTRYEIWEGDTIREAVDGPPRQFQPHAFEMCILLGDQCNLCGQPAVAAIHDWLKSVT